MKHFLLSSVALLVAAVGYGQNNTATLAQTGTNQIVTGTQTGNSLTATVSQVGTTATNTNNLGLSFQTGTGHLSTINQDNGSRFNRAGITQSNAVGSSGSNTATISQSNGSGGVGFRGNDPASAAGDGNWTGILQGGNNNKATQTQDGAGTTKNFAETWQQGSNNTATTNQSGATDGRAQIYQGNIDGSIVGNVTNNGATIDQSGSSRNDAVVTQLTSGNSATVLQSGAESSDNIADIKQGTTANRTGGGNVAIIQQETNPNPPGAGTGTAFSTFNQAFIVQLGTSSYADIKQRKDADDNYAEINQLSGDGSKAFIQQEFEATSQNEAVINQYGDRQYAYASQIKASNNELMINQGAAGISSSGNTAYSYQSFSTNGRVTIAQNTTATGGDNYAKVVQGFYIADPARTNGNVASVQQDGSNNQTRLIQTSVENTITGNGLTATGVGRNTANIGQYGNNNVVGGPATSPDPNNNPDPVGAASQDGGLNEMTVVQNSTAAAAAADFNTASLTQTGRANTLSLDQTAEAVGNMATVTQTGNMNQAVFQQNGVNN